MKWTLIILLLAVACSDKTAAPREQATEKSGVSLTAEQIRNAGVETGYPQEEDMAATMKLQGQIDVPPQNIVSISFPLGGYLKSTRLLPGTHVSKGEVLAVLEDMQFIQLQQDYLTAKARITLLQEEFERQQELNNTQAGSSKAFQQARTDLDMQKILLRSLEEKLKLIGINFHHLNEANISNSVAIYSPINGFVSRVNVNIGKYTSPTDILFELINPRDIHLGLTVFEKDISRIAIGQKVSAYTNDQPQQKHAATVILISKNLDESRSTQVHCHFNAYDKLLLPGMFMNAEIEVKNKRALAVPEEAVVRWQNQPYVFVEKGDNEFEMQQVETGILQHGKQEILPGHIGKETKVVTKNAFALLMKLKNSGEEE